MKITPILENEYLPVDKSKSSASGIGAQLARVALAKSGGNPHKAKMLADQLANRFLSDIMAAIDDEIGFNKAPSVDVSA